MNQKAERREVYLDHAATTPTDPDLVQAMIPVLADVWGNPSSSYGRGRAARQVLEEARAEVAGVLGCKAGEIIFTSGGTEGDNLAIKGAVFAAMVRGMTGGHIITTAFEHHAVLHTCEFLQRFGFRTTYVGVGADGVVDPEDIRRAIQPDTVLISVMYANNEIGTVQPLAAIGDIARAHKIPFHTDAVQAPGYLPLRVNDLKVDMLSLAAHKFYGPKGVGIFYVRRGTRLSWQQQGGSQENDRRAGTENVPFISFAARALTKAEALRESDVPRIRDLRDSLLAGLRERLGTDSFTMNGTLDQAGRMPNNLNLSFAGVPSQDLILALDLQGIAASAGSACTTGAVEPSHVLSAIGCSDADAVSALRLTLGRHTTAADIAYVVDVLPPIVRRLRALYAPAGDTFSGIDGTGYDALLADISA